jgi:hypothetical protein
MTAKNREKKIKEHKPDESLTSADYERIGRSIESVVIHGHYSKRRLFLFNTLRGLFFGLGSAVGATVVLVLIVWILNAFSEIPLIGDLFESARTTVEEVNARP